MIKGVKEVKNSFHSRYLNTIAIERVLQGDVFPHAYEAATEQQKIVALKLIQELDREKLIEWARAQLKENNLIETMTVMELRKMGQELGVKNYVSLTKLQLISAITQTLMPINGCINGEHSNCIFVGDKLC